ncbi:MAG: Tol-Pal system beta propeller repeat protein TolB, partial [Nitrospiria bacterium]
MNTKNPVIMTLLLATFLNFSAYGNSYGKAYIDITSPSLKKTPIAIAEFRDLFPSNSNSLSDLSDSLRSILVNDLEFSGLFDILDKESYWDDLKKTGIQETEIDFNRWEVQGGTFLITGGYRESPTGKECREEKEFVVELRLFDVIKEKRILGKMYCSNKRELRMAMHRFSNEILKALTGESGIYESRLAFVSTFTGNKEIYISDYDGHNIQAITKNGSINISPQWSPDGRWLLYTSFKKGQPKLYIKNPFTGKEVKISDYPGMNIGARWSPSRTEIAFTLSIHGNPEIYTMDLKTNKLTRLTNSWGIDVSPTWSPDGKRIAFISDRGGNPHIYLMDVYDKTVKRLTYEESYNVSPAWSPKGDKIAFSRLNNGHFDIWIMDLDSGYQTQLTHNVGNNEDPSWSPDERHIVFKSDRDGYSSIYIMRTDGTDQRQIARGS